MGAITFINCENCGDQLKADDLESAEQLTSRARNRGWLIDFNRPDWEWTSDDDKFDFCHECADAVHEEIATWEQEQEDEKRAVEERARYDKRLDLPTCRSCGAPVDVLGNFDETRVKTPA